MSKIEGFDADEEPVAGPSTSPLPPSGSDKGKARASEGPEESDASDLEDTCAICLADVRNQAEAFPCHHNAFCYACLHTWCAVSRKCPLCMTPVDYLMTHVRSATDFQKHHLLPLAASAPSSRSASDPPVFPAAADIELATGRRLFNRPTHRRQSRWEWGRKNRRLHLDEAEEEELALQRRRWIYRHRLYAKHVASNYYTRYQTFTPAQFAHSAERKNRIMRFARRELKVFPSVDVDWLCTYLVQIMCALAGIKSNEGHGANSHRSQLDLRSDNAVRLLAEFLGVDQAEHFAHEVLSFARSSFADLKQWDHFTQYDRPDCRESPSPSLRRDDAPHRRRSSHTRPRSPEPIEWRGDHKRRRSLGPLSRRTDSYVPDYRPHTHPRRSLPRDSRDRSPPRDWSGGEGSRLVPEIERPVQRRVSTSPTPLRPKAALPDQRPKNRERRTSVATIDDEGVAPLEDAKGNPLRHGDSLTALTKNGIFIRGLAGNQGRSEHLPARSEVQSTHTALSAMMTVEQRREALREKLEREKTQTAKRSDGEALKAKLLVKLEEERRRAHLEVEPSSKNGGPNGTENMQDDGAGYDREVELRRALEARIAAGKAQINPKARIRAEISAVEAKLLALKTQMGSSH